MSCRMRSVKKVLRNYLASRGGEQGRKRVKERESKRRRVEVLVADKDKELPQAAGKNSFSLKSLCVSNSLSV